MIKKEFQYFYSFFISFFSIFLKMSVMTLIDSSKLGDIRKEFRKYKDTLEKFKFVQVLMNYLPKTLKKDKNFDRTETVKQILDLFHQVL